jgi:hypothetical protein
MNISEMTDSVQIYEFLYEKCQEDDELLAAVLDEYVSSLNETEMLHLEDFLVNNFGDL